MPIYRKKLAIAESPAAGREIAAKHHNHTNERFHGVLLFERA
jgi:hypothetical protein